MRKTHVEQWAKYAWQGKVGILNEKLERWPKWMIAEFDIKPFV